MQYRKKPVLVEAFCYGKEPHANWFTDKAGDGSILVFSDHCVIHTLEGDMQGNTGDWIIRGVKGEMYPCKDAIFQETYEPAQTVRRSGGQAVPDSQKTAKKPRKKK